MMDDMNYLPLFRFIVKNDQENIKDFLKGKDLDIGDFKNFISENLLAGSLYPLVADTYLKSLFSGDLIEYFKSYYLVQWARNEQLIKEIERLGKLFRDSDKQIIFLKGPLLAKRFYGNIDRRFIGDIDILVKEEDFNGIIENLEKDGYSRVSGIPLNQRLAFYFAHHLEYRKDSIKLEPHWVLSRHLSFNIDYDRVWRTKQEFIFRDNNFWVLSDEYALVCQILTIFKDIELGTVKLRSFLDLYLVLKNIGKNIDWDEFFTIRKKELIFSISLNILDLVLDAMDSYSEFENLTNYIKKRSSCINSIDKRKTIKLLKRSRFPMQNKLWAFKLYDTNIIKTFWWWAISLPFRMIVYREQSLKILRNKARNVVA